MYISAIAKRFLYTGIFRFSLFFCYFCSSIIGFSLKSLTCEFIITLIYIDVISRSFLCGSCSFTRRPSLLQNEGSFVGPWVDWGEESTHLSLRSALAHCWGGELELEGDAGGCHLTIEITP